jgi:hypothetical protein
MRQICEAVKEAGIFVVLGYSERAGASLYIAQSFISPEGKIVLHRRKIKPTRKFYDLDHSKKDNWQSDTYRCRALNLGRRPSRKPYLRRGLTLRKGWWPELLGAPTTLTSLL